MTTSPRARSGAHFHELGTEVYAVALDSSDREVSDRHAGHAWISLSSGTVEFMFVDDHGGNSSNFITTRAPLALARVGVFIDGDLAMTVPIRGEVVKGDCITVDWSAMYEAMA